MPKLTRKDAEEILDRLSDGEGASAIADSIGVKRHAIYNALRRYKLQLPEKEDHIALQQASKAPPELYAYRAGISAESLRVKAWQRGEPLAVTSNAARKEYWSRLFESFDGLNTREFCAAMITPVAMVAYWYHRIKKPNRPLLWGMQKAIELDPEVFEGLPVKYDPQALFAVGMGSRVKTIDSSTASRIYRERNT